MIILTFVGVCGVVAIGAFSMLIADILFRGPKNKGWKK